MILNPFPPLLKLAEISCWSVTKPLKFGDSTTDSIQNQRTNERLRCDHASILTATYKGIPQYPLHPWA